MIQTVYCWGSQRKVDVSALVLVSASASLHLGRLFPQLSRWLVSSLLLGSGLAGMGGFGRLCVCRLNYILVNSLLIYCYLPLGVIATHQNHVPCWNSLLVFFLWCNFIYSNVGTTEASFSPSAPILFCGQPFA